MTDPTIYEIIRLVTDILMPIIVLGLAYYLGTKGINKYQIRKDKNSKREMIIRELAEFHNLEILNVKMFFDSYEGRKTTFNPLVELTHKSAIISGLSKVYYNKEDSKKFLIMMDQYGKVAWEVWNNRSKFSLDQHDKYVIILSNLYFRLLEFIKTTEIYP